MGETRGARGAAAIGQLRRQVLALTDADCLRPEDGKALLAALDTALRGLAAGDGPAASEGIERFLAGLQLLTADGLLAEREAHPPVEVARALLAALRGPSGAPSAESGPAAPGTAAMPGSG